MSALPPKADMSSATLDVRFGPIADIRHIKRLLRVVKDNADRMAHTAADAADAVAEIDPISAFRSLYRPVVYREGDRIAFTQRDYFGPALHSRTLFSQDKLSAGEVAFGLGKEDCDLQREGEVAV